MEGAVEFSQISENAAQLLIRRLYTGTYFYRYRNRLLNTNSLFNLFDNDYLPETDTIFILSACYKQCVPGLTTLV